MFYLIFLLFAVTNATRCLKYNTRYAISKPHYVTNLQMKEKNFDYLPDYEIPKWVYKTLFKYNKPTKKYK
jgi:hypothetical protein